MKTKQKKKLKHKLALLAVIIAAIALAFVVSGRIKTSEPEPQDPHEGMVEVFDGSSLTWIRPAEGMPVNPFTEEDFSCDENGVPSFIGEGYASFRGIDVSEYQGDIDWEQVKQSGIDFVILRAGLRGYGIRGKLITDSRFTDNLAGAKAAGLKVGAYFFSQAISGSEAIEEAKLALSLIDGEALDLPIYYDWEFVESNDARTNDMNGPAITDCALAFCETVENAGYEAGIYSNVNLSYYYLDLGRLSDYAFWCAAPGDLPYSYYHSGMWQYSFRGSVPGIETECDMDMMFVKYE